MNSKLATRNSCFIFPLQKGFVTDFEIKISGEYHHLYVQRNTLLLTGALTNFRKICPEMYWLDPANFFSAPGLAWQVVLKKTKVKLELLTDIVMLLIVENGIRNGIFIYSSLYKI